MGVTICGQPSRSQGATPAHLGAQRLEEVRTPLGQFGVHTTNLEVAPGTNFFSRELRRLPGQVNPFRCHRLCGAARQQKAGTPSPTSSLGS